MSKPGEPAEGPEIEIASAVVLAVAGLLTAFVGFQADLYDGEQASKYAQFNAMRMQASRMQLQADQLQSLDVNLFSQWLDAKAGRDERLADFYRTRFPANLQPPFESWLALNPLRDEAAPRSPFVMPNYRRDDGSAAQMQIEADKTFKAGEVANQISDDFNRGNVLLALAMFLAGITQVFHVRTLRIGLVGLAGLACIVGIFRVLTLPIQWPA